MNGKVDKIDINETGNLFQLFCHRVRRTPNKLAYRYFDRNTSQWTELTWSEMADHVAHWQAALKNEDLSPGDRVALMVGNSPNWVMFEQAAIGLGLVVVPLYTNDRSENVCYIIDDAQIKVFLVETNEQWRALEDGLKHRQSLKRIVTLDEINNPSDGRLLHISKWLPDPTQRSSSCSTTTSVLPLASRRCRTSSRMRLSRGCRPIVGSSRM